MEAPPGKSKNMAIIRIEFGSLVLRHSAGKEMHFFLSRESTRLYAVRYGVIK